MIKYYKNSWNFDFYIIYFCFLCYGVISDIQFKSFRGCFDFIRNCKIIMEMVELFF